MSSDSVMKKARNEHVFNAIGQYMRKRQYADTETYKKNEVKLQQNLQDMALQSAANNEASVRNVIEFSSVNRDVTVIDQQFTRLKVFISEGLEPYKSELTYILFPVFVHLYLEMIVNGQKTPAIKFCSRHQGLFLDVPQYKEIIEDLNKVVTAQDLPKYLNIKAFRENKYVVKLTDEATDYLMRYLKNNDHLILLQILNLYIEIKVCSKLSEELQLYEENAIESDKEVPVLPTPPELKNELEEAELKSLKESIRKVRDGSPNLPSICLYSFTNNVRGLSSCCLSNDISLLAGGFEDSSIRLWNLTPTTSSNSSTNICNHKVSRIRLACDYTPINPTGDPLNTSDADSHLGNETRTLRAHSGPVYGLTFIENSPLLISCSQDTTIRAWNLETDCNVSIYRGHNYPVWDLDCSPLFTYFATGSQDRSSKLYYLDRTFPVRSFVGHTMDVDCVKFHPNGNYLGTGSSDRSVRLWNIQDGKMVRLFQGHRGTVFSLAFSPNGQLLASAGEDRRIRLWDIGSGSLIKELRGHVDTVYCLTFNQDSSALASGGLDGSIRLWDVRKGFSAANTSDGHTSAELLSSYSTKPTGIHMLKYSFHNVLAAVGAKIN
ncbi:TAF5-like RNA polymerase II, p300 CBP-associated factor (PCAF)-associated factor [Chamberlinius hualienensis]